jgi:hypothetical protein
MDKNALKFTQPILIQSYSDKFDLLTRIYNSPVQAGSVLVADKKVQALSPVTQKKYCSGTGKAMHAMQYSKPETYSVVQDLSQHMHEATKDHYKAMLHVLKYSADMANQGLVLKPNRKWDGSQNHEHIISGTWTWTMPRSLKTGAASQDTWCTLREHQLCSKAAQRRQCNFHY